MVAVGQPLIFVAMRQPQRIPGESKRAGVEEHVPGVSQQGEGIGEQTAGDLDQHEAGDQQKGSAEQRFAVRVIVLMCVGQLVELPGGVGDQLPSRSRIAATASMPASSVSATGMMLKKRQPFSA